MSMCHFFYTAINPCPAGHGCQHVCFTGDDVEFKCTCDANYELDSDGRSCRGIKKFCVYEFQHEFTAKYMQ